MHHSWPLERACRNRRIGDLGDLSPTGVQFVACGTSYHAALHGAQLFREAGVPAQAFLASEYATGTPPIGDALVVGVTQSGETADTLSALRAARRRGARTLAVTNVVGSTAARERATRCTSALVRNRRRRYEDLRLAASRAEPARPGTRTTDGRELVEALSRLPGHVQEILDTSVAPALAQEIEDSEVVLLHRPWLPDPVALEGALRMKEITYKHAEGFAAGELKHGPLALVTENTPCSYVPGDVSTHRKAIGGVYVVEARDDPLVTVTDGPSDVERCDDLVLHLPGPHRGPLQCVESVPCRNDYMRNAVRWRRTP